MRAAEARVALEEIETDAQEDEAAAAEVANEADAAFIDDGELMSYAQNPGALHTMAEVRGQRICISCTCLTHLARGRSTRGRLRVRAYAPRLHHPCGQLPRRPRLRRRSSSASASPGRRQRTGPSPPGHRPTPQPSAGSKRPLIESSAPPQPPTPPAPPAPPQPRSAPRSKYLLHHRSGLSTNNIRWVSGVERGGRGARRCGTTPCRGGTMPFLPGCGSQNEHNSFSQ